MAGAFAGAHPTSTPVIDPLYSAALAGLVTVACALSKRWTWLVLSAAAFAMSRSWLLVPAGVALGLAFWSAVSWRRRREVGALCGALAVQTLLRWPSVGFHGLTAAVAALAVLPCLLSAFRLAPARWRRRVLWAGGGCLGVALLGGVPLALGTWAAVGPVNRGVTAAQTALKEVGDGGGFGATADLARASVGFSKAHRLTGSWWSVVAELVPIEAQTRRALAESTAAGTRVANVGQNVTDRLSALKASYHEGSIDLSILPPLEAPLQQLSGQIALAQQEMAGASSGWLLQPLARRVTQLEHELRTTGYSARLSAQAVPLLPGILGGDGIRHYFVAFMTPAESRGLDGIIDTYGELTANNGQVRLTRSGDFEDLLRAAGLNSTSITGPADYLARYGSFGPASHPLDISYSPDLPTVTEVLGQVFPEMGGDHIDGVLALDPIGLAALLNFTGPITVAGLPEQLTAANAAQVLTVGQYEQFDTSFNGEAARADFLDGALTVGFTKLTTGSLPSLANVSSIVDEAVRGGHLLFWSTHPAEQPLLREVDISGQFPQPDGGDVLAVTTQNSDSNKIDSFLQRTIHDAVHVTPSSGAVSSTVTIALDNSAPRSGISSEIIGNQYANTLPSGSNYTWMSVYSPLHLDSCSEGPTKLAMTSTPELGSIAHSAYVIVPPESTVTITCHLSGRLDLAHGYRLSIRSQPMVHADRDSVVVSASGGRTATWDPAPQWLNQADFTFHK